MSQGNVIIGELPYYEDYESLKKWVRSQENVWVKNSNRQVTSIINQAGTNSEVELENKSGETIADIGKVGVTWVAQISAWAEAVVVTLTWKDNTGASTTSTITLTDANETAFTVPITTGYCATACSIDVVNPGGVTVKVGVSGMAAPVATIQAAATAAVEADLSGVGKVMVVQKTDQVATDAGQKAYIDYITPWAELKYAVATTDAADTSTEVVLYEATKSAAGVYTATTVIVKDFYRRREFKFAMAATDELLLVAVGGATVYAVVGVSYEKSVHTRYTVPDGCDAWLGHLCLNQSIATNLDTYMLMTYTPYGSTISHTCKISIPNNGLFEVDPLFRLASKTELKFIIKGNLSDNSIVINILEAVQV